MDIVNIVIARREKMIDSAVLYTTHCPRCKVLEKKLQQAGIIYSIVDDRETLLSLGFTEVPMLQINCGKTMNFKEANEWLKEATNG
jgi:deoxycytidylate deaminase